MLKESTGLVTLGVTFDAKMTFEKHLRSVSRAAAQRFCIMIKFWQVFHDRSLLLRYFWSFVLPFWSRCSAADSHLNTLRGWVVDKASVPIGAGGFRPDVNVYAISNFLPLSLVLEFHLVSNCSQSNTLQEYGF